MFPYKQFYWLCNFLPCFKPEGLRQKYTPKIFFLVLNLQVNFITTTSYTKFSIPALFFRHSDLQNVFLHFVLKVMGVKVQRLCLVFYFNTEFLFNKSESLFIGSTHRYFSHSGTDGVSLHMQFLGFPHNVHVNSHSNDYIKYSKNSNKHIKETVPYLMCFQI